MVGGMTRAVLAKKLRAFLDEANAFFGNPPSDHSRSDDQEIEMYNHCPQPSCGKRAIPLDDLDLVIAPMKNEQEYLDRIDEIIKKTPDRAHVPECPVRLMLEEEDRRRGK